MSRHPRRLSADERVLWDEVIRSVTPLHDLRADGDDEPTSETKAVAGAPPPKAVPRPAAPRAPPLPPPAPPALTPLAPLGRRLKHSLARGVQSIEGRLDLHGLTQAQAHGVLVRFLADAQARGVKTVLVITGKSRGEAEGSRGVLARQVPQWLRMPDLRGCVIGFETAHRAHGGEGALYVRVRRARSAE